MMSPKRAKIVSSVRNRLLAVIAAVCLVLAGGVAFNPVAAHANPVELSKYTFRQGYYESNGRHWSAYCEKYTAKITRCRTDIWATQVTYENGQYIHKTGWFFNNLTYLPSDIDAWGIKHPFLGDKTFTSDGRDWKIECYDSLSIINGTDCRGYIYTKVVSSFPVYGQPGKYTYKTSYAWVYNHVVISTAKFALNR